MGVVLFPHNQTAYESVCRMLTEIGKAAVIHPTGTGKSFIGFKLIEEHPDASFLWLSPSEYIFHSQADNLYRCNPEAQLANVTYITYARLMQMSSAALKDLEADYIILDEFHRCGARQWGMGVENLLKQKPESRLLGLTATNVRYLDNQRDMAEELFQNHIASRMTLGEAIVRGILPPPKYVTAIYGWQQELEKYQQRVQAQKSAGVRSHTQSYLNTLRHALEKADGLQRVFARHIQRKDGKYIVFCAGLDHMRTIVSHVPEWFGAIDLQPHCYQAFSDNPESSQAFQNFNNDDSTHLKLLFCIDMLNEGIHVRGVSGVILFRPTVSPIIYKQQVGRALTSGTMDTPLIIDVAANYENLCSVDAIRTEMEEAAEHLRTIGAGKEIITQYFEVTEQIRDCRKLFEALEKSLGNGWETCYQAAKAYYEIAGDLEVPDGYVTEGGIRLGSWLGTQRRIYNRKAVGSLTEKQIRRLDQIGMRWGSRDDYVWQRNLELAGTYVREHGDLLVHHHYETEDGIRLGQWIHNLRQQYRQGKLSEEKVHQLEEIGMVWNVADARWEQYYQAARQYYEAKGHLQVPTTYTTAEGIALGDWIRNTRKIQNGSKKGTPLSEERVRKLEEIGMQWESRTEEKWMRNYESAKAYYEQHGNLNVPRTYRTADGLALQHWLYEQRRFRRKQEARGLSMPTERIFLLNQIGMEWEQNEN